jgi:hypothetical protein
MLQAGALLRWALRLFGVGLVSASWSRGLEPFRQFLNRLYGLYLLVGIILISADMWSGDWDSDLCADQSLSAAEDAVGIICHRSAIMALDFEKTPVTARPIL